MPHMRSAKKLQADRTNLEARLKERLDSIVEMYDHMMMPYTDGEHLSPIEKDQLRESIKAAMRESA